MYPGDTQLGGGLTLSPFCAGGKGLEISSRELQKASQTENSLGTHTALAKEFTLPSCAEGRVKISE